MSITGPTVPAVDRSEQRPSFHLTSISFRLADSEAACDGWPLTHPYIETFWLPVIGPTATLMLRFIGRHVTLNSYKVFDPAEVSFCLGISVRSGRHSAMPKTVKRLAHFGLATIDSGYHDTDYRITFPASVPAVPIRLQTKWPEHLRILHSRAVARRHIDAARERS